MDDITPVKPYFIGLMSGTSLDGVDGVLASFDTSTPGSAATQRVLGHVHVPFPAPLRDALFALQGAGPDELHRAAMASNGLVDVYAEAISRLLSLTSTKAAQIRAIGAHGQTVRHRPELGYTLQLNAPARLAERAGVDVIADFRSRDVAAGGQGAPLVPAFHADLFGDSGRHRVVVNIGGMANVTNLPADALTPVRGWDTGPGNCLLDGWIQRHRNVPFDRDGAWATQGTVAATLLARLKSEPWFATMPPKSTGRDRFNMAWLDRQLSDHAPLSPADIQATLAELTAQTVADEISRHCAGVAEVIICGGGAWNTDLIGRVQHALARSSRVAIPVTNSATLGWPPDQVEALAFAWLAQRFVLGLPGNLPAVTGARGARVLGALYPA